MKRFILAASAVLALNSALAAEVAGVRVDDRVRVGNADLILNGAGLRKKAFFKVYVAGLYLAERRADGDAVLGSPGAKRVSIRLMRDLSAQQFVDALHEGLAANHGETEMAALKDRMKQFSDTLLALGEAKEGMTITIDWLPESGTRLSVAGQPKGKDIAGEDFYKALLRVWVGAKPVQDDLKAALLGKSA